MDELVRQCRAAAAWTFRNARVTRRRSRAPLRVRAFGGRASRRHAPGHRLAAFRAGASRRAGERGVAFSGLYDLEPIRLCYLNDTLKLSPTRRAGIAPFISGPRIRARCSSRWAASRARSIIARWRRSPGPGTTTDAHRGGGPGGSRSLHHRDAAGRSRLPLQPRRARPDGSGLAGRIAREGSATSRRARTTSYGDDDRRRQEGERADQPAEGEEPTSSPVAIGDCRRPR